MVLQCHITDKYIPLFSIPRDFKYKDVILSSIKYYLDNIDNLKIKVTKKVVKIEHLSSLYNKSIVSKIRKNLIPINKEDSRDVLTKFGLIKDNDLILEKVHIVLLKPLLIEFNFKESLIILLGFKIEKNRLIKPKTYFAKFICAIGFMTGKLVPFSNKSFKLK